MDCLQNVSWKTFGPHIKLEWHTVEETCGCGVRGKHDTLVFIARAVKNYEQQCIAITVFGKYDSALD